MNHLMIDLETMGNKPAAPIVAIGAVFFDPKSGELGAEFYVAVNLASAMEQGATPDGATILWWLKQSAEARAAICTDDTRSITFALSELSSFISRNSDNPRYLKVWGNGANFDNVILRLSLRTRRPNLPVAILERQRRAHHGAARQTAWFRSQARYAI